MRPANLITAVADILCGAFIAGVYFGSTFSLDLVLLCISSAGLYAGGVVFNDVFDAGLDKTERPERPIPSGKITITAATYQGSLLLLFAILLAFLVSFSSGIIALSIAVLAVFYDAVAKHHFLTGPVFMASCRAANLLLGISIMESKLATLWPLIFIPFIYIFTITFISRNEVNGIIKNKAIMAIVGYSVVLLLFLSSPADVNLNVLSALPFLGGFILFVFPPLIRLLQDGKPENVRKTVKAGVLGLVILDATLASGYVDIIHGISILLLLPLSISVARYFAVT